MVIKFLFLAFSTVFTITFIVNLIKGKKYQELVTNLDSSEFFLKDLYVVGFSLNDTKLFKLRGKIGKTLRKQAKLLWDNIYFEYYANLAWAQFLSLSILVLALGLSLCAFLNIQAAIVIFFIVLIFVFAIYYLSIAKMKETVSKRRDACVEEFPNMVSKLSLLINSGMVLHEAWNVVANGKDGELYTLMKKACELMENGESDVEAIHKFGILSDSPEIKKFTSAMIQGVEKGNSELSDFLISQSTELWEHKRQIVLQKGEIAAGKLIIPLGFMFAGIIMIIVAAAMQSMSF